jgi:glycosyltransferase involved in cell wall biosynthesis
MINRIFILLPSDIPSGPVKGAYALANSLVDHYRVTLVTIKQGSGASARIDSRVRRICLSDHSTQVYGKLIFYKRLLLEAGGPTQTVSLSLCLSADIFNILCKSSASTLSSVRGNLFVNYQHDFGLLGAALAFIHIFALRRIQNVIAMNSAMAMQIHAITGRKPSVISNFIDEPMYKSVECSKSHFGSYRFLFLGSLSSRKQPAVIIKALKKIRDLGVDASLNYIGSGPEVTTIEKLADELRIRDYISISGFVSRPEIFIVESDVLVLPSLSEGISRAAMEALFLGVPCVLRDVDGSSELIIEGKNGSIFRDEAQLASSMLIAVEISRSNEYRQCLLPHKFRQSCVTGQYLELISSLNLYYLK